MKIALFSDIHANLPALEAFFADVETHKPDAIYCLGDLVGYNIFPNEVIEEIRRRGIATIAGNHDLKIKGLVTEPHHLTEEGKNYAYHLVSDENRAYLATLPAHIRLEYNLTGEPLNIYLAHGSIRSVDEYTLEDTNEAYIIETMTEVSAGILCVGHSHKPYHRVIKDNGRVKHVVNIGSVGKPKDGNPDACYVIITLNEDSSPWNADSIKVEFIRVAYNVEKAAQAVENSPLPNAFAHMLRKAY